MSDTVILSESMWKGDSLEPHWFSSSKGICLSLAKENLSWFSVVHGCSWVYAYEHQEKKDVFILSGLWWDHSPHSCSFLYFFLYKCIVCVKLSSIFPRQYYLDSISSYLWVFVCASLVPYWIPLCINIAQRLLFCFNSTQHNQDLFTILVYIYITAIWWRSGSVVMIVKWKSLFLDLTGRIIAFSHFLSFILFCLLKCFSF